MPKIPKKKTASCPVTITDAAHRNHEELFPNHQSTLKVTDPELIEIFDNFAFDEVLPLASYVALTASACMTHPHARAALFTVAAAALLLLFIGIHNAWDAVTYHVFVRRRSQGESEPRDKPKE